MELPNHIEKALWYIERYYDQPLTLDKIAAFTGVSSCYLTRSFGRVTGKPLMRYLRARRLSMAAEKLVKGEDDILQLAVKAGYSSHEAFSRAFRAQFGITPDRTREVGSIEDLESIDPIKIQEKSIDITAPQIVDSDEFVVARLRKYYECEKWPSIPAQWQKFQPYLDGIRNRTDDSAYGICADCDHHSGFNYICAVKISEPENLNPNLTVFQVPKQKYAVFTHPGHISNIGCTWNSIYSKWQPNSNYEILNTLSFEFYDQHYNTNSGQGDVQIWVPVESCEAIESIT